jgi:hypothetical protein
MASPGPQFPNLLAGDIFRRLAAAAADIPAPTRVSLAYEFLAIRLLNAVQLQICAQCSKHVAAGPVRTINKKDKTTDTVACGRACGFTDGSACASCARSKRSGCGLVSTRLRVCGQGSE